MSEQLFPTNKPLPSQTMCCESEPRLNYYELARQFDFQAQEFASVGWYKIYGCLMSQYLNAA